MSSNNWNGTVIAMQKAGSALTAAAAASMLDPSAKLTFPANVLKVADVIRIQARGIISNVITTPGTARFDVRMGATVIFDTGALNLNVVAKTNVPWTLELDLLIRSYGASTATQSWGQGTFTSEAVIGSPLPSVGGNGVLNVPVSGIALSTGWDSTISNVVDSFFTQTVATGSMTCESFRVIYET